MTARHHSMRRFSAIMIPMHRAALERDDAPRRLGALTIVVGLIPVLVMAVIQLLGEWWVDAMVGGFTDQGRQLTLHFVRMMSLGMPASAMLSVLAAGEIGRTCLTNIRASVLDPVAVGLLLPTAALSALNRLRRTFRVKGELG